MPPLRHPFVAAVEVTIAATETTHTHTHGCLQATRSFDLLSMLLQALAMMVSRGRLVRVLPGLNQFSQARG